MRFQGILNDTHQVFCGVRLNTRHVGSMKRVHDRILKPLRFSERSYLPVVFGSQKYQLANFGKTKAPKALKALSSWHIVSKEDFVPYFFSGNYTKISAKESQYINFF